MTATKRYAYRCDGLAGEVFLDPTRSPNSVAIFCFGFPGTIGPNPIVNLLAASGYAVVVHQYAGTYDSDGYFTPQASVDSITTIAHRLAEGNFTDIKKGNPIPIGDYPQTKLIVGHSFGCFLGGRAATQIRGVEAVLLLAPILGYGHVPFEYGVLEDGIAQLEYVRRARPHTYRFSDLDDWRALFRGERNSWSPRQINAKRVLAVVGDADPDFNVRLIVPAFPAILTSLYGRTVQGSISVVPGAGHSVDDLLTDEVKEWVLQATARNI
jgi:hypothetical protein